MGQWRANEGLYGPNGGEWVDPNGMVTPDPWGTLNPAAQQAKEFIQETQVQPPSAEPKGPHETPGAPPALNTPEGMQAAMAAPQPQPGLANQAAAAGAQPPPTPPGPGKGPDFVSVTDSKTSTSTGTTGLDDASAARVKTGIDNQQDASQKADTAAVSFEQFKAQQMAEQGQAKLASAAEGFADVAAKQAVQDHITEEVDRRLNAGGPNSKDAAGLGSAYWRPDPTELFRGDHGALFGISAAIAAMSGAWMQGRGLTGQNPYLPTIMKMIDDNVNQQVRQNSSAFQHLKDIKGDVKAAKLELKERQLAYAQAQSDGMALRANSEIVQKGSAVLAEKLTAEREKLRAEQEKQLNKTVTQNVTKDVSRRMVANPNGAAAGKPSTYESQRAQRLSQTGRTLATLERGVKSGKLAEGVGWFDESMHGIARSLGVNDAQVTEQVNALGRNAMNEVMGLVREPSNKLQEQFANLVVPQNDSEIPVFMQELRATYEMAKAEAEAEGGRSGANTPVPSRVE